MSISAPPRFVLDRSGFPMLWVNALQAHLGCVPITKIQLEYFLCDTTETRFGAEFYERLLQRNPRESPGKLTDQNYFRAFATGVTPTDAEAYAEWCGADRDEVFALPTRSEWFAAYKELKAQPAMQIAELTQLGLTPRVELLFRRLDAAAARVQSIQGARTLADSLLFQRGVYEWVRCEDGKWRGAGMPHPSLGAGIVVLEHERPRDFPDLENGPHSCGFRLLKRGG